MADHLAVNMIIFTQFHTVVKVRVARVEWGGRGGASTTRLTQ